MRFELIHAHAVFAMKREFESTILPLAKVAKVIPQNATPQSLLVEKEVVRPGDGVKFVGCELVHVLVIVLALASRDARLDPEEKYSKWSQMAVDAGKLMTHTFGYLSAIVDQGSAISASGAASKRRSGRARLEAVRTAASAHRHRSKSAAAPLIASAVGLSPEVVRRYLSQLFPGKSWEESADG